MKTTDKIDLYKQNKLDYTAKKAPVLLDIGEAIYLSIDGRGEPGGTVFTDKIGSLYGVAFTIKMTRKFAGEQDYAVSKLEAQWWAEGAEQCLARASKDQWCWKLLIRTPDFVTGDDLSKAAAVLIKRGKSPSAKEVRLEPLAEGKCVQMLHVGPYEREPETIALMKDFAETKGYQFHGRHHEIYLSDPRRVPAEKLKTILRVPVISQQ